MSRTGVATLIVVALGACGPAPQVGHLAGPGIIDEASPSPSPSPAPSPRTNPSPSPSPDPIAEADDDSADRVVVASTDPVIAEHVYFKPNSALLDAAGLPILKEVAATMQAHPDVELLEIQGHIASGERGAKLDQTRADNARRYLITQGVAPERLSARGYGATRPLDPAATDAARARNRRVEFTIALRVDLGPEAPPR